MAINHSRSARAYTWNIINIRTLNIFILRTYVSNRTTMLWTLAVWQDYKLDAQHQHIWWCTCVIARERLTNTWNKSCTWLEYAAFRMTRCKLSKSNTSVKSVSLVWNTVDHSHVFTLTCTFSKLHEHLAKINNYRCVNACSLADKQQKQQRLIQFRRHIGRFYTPHARWCYKSE